MIDNAFMDQVTETLPWLPPWAVAAGAGALIIAAGLALQAFATGRLSRAWPAGARTLAETKGVTRFAVVVLAAAIVLPLLPIGRETIGTMQRVLTAGVILLIGWACAVAITIMTDRYERRLNLGDPGDFAARKMATQLRILTRFGVGLIAVVATGFALMTFDTVRQYGISLFASAGVAGIVAGLAARPLLSNLLAGIQLALTQPIRINDSVVVEGEWGWVEEFTSTHVVIRIWDLRRLILPLSYFLEKPFQNWTRAGSSLIGTVFLYVDYAVPVDELREELKKIVSQTPLWDGRVVNLQVTDAKEQSIEIRALVSAANAENAWDLRCLVREKMIFFIHNDFPKALPRRREEIAVRSDSGNGNSTMPAHIQPS